MNRASTLLFNAWDAQSNYDLLQTRMTLCDFKITKKTWKVLLVIYADFEMIDRKIHKHASYPDPLPSTTKMEVCRLEGSLHQAYCDLYRERLWEDIYWAFAWRTRWNTRHSFDQEGYGDIWRVWWQYQISHISFSLRNNSKFMSKVGHHKGFFQIRPRVSE